MGNNTREKEERGLEILNNSTKPQIENSINYIFDHLSDDHDAGVLVVDVIERVASLIEDEDDQEIETMLMEELDFIISIFPLFTMSLVFDVKLVGLEKNIYRKIEVPAMFGLSDLAYTVLGTMNAEGVHLYDIEYGDNIYSCTYADPDDSLYPHEFKYAHDYGILNLDLETNNKMMLTYDFGDNYEFEITFLKVNNHRRLQIPENMKILNGRGPGIWEDHHDLLDLYYNDRNEYNRFVKEYDIDDFDFKVDLKVNILKNLKASFLDSYLLIKETYEEVLE